MPVKLDEARLRQVVRDCREHGCLVESLTPAGWRLYSLMAGAAAYALPDGLRELVGELVSSLGERVHLGANLAPRRKHAVSLLAAPTFGAREPVLTMYVGAAITGAEIARRGVAPAVTADTVTATADTVTAEAGAVSSWRRGPPTGSR